MNILRDGNAKAKRDNTKKFNCDVCGCLWTATKDEYKEDWSKHSIPAYCKCPCCGTMIYAIGTFKTDKIKTHVKEN